MKPLFLLPLGAFSLCAQPFSFGVKGGVPLTDFVDTRPYVGYSTDTNRYIVGGTVELRLPLGLALEVDALYRHLNYASNSCLLGLGCGQSKTVGNSWEFPLLAKYRLPVKVVRPYVDAGIAWDTLTGLSQTKTQEDIFGTVFSNTLSSHPSELYHHTTEGFVIGGGIDLHVVLIHISPEIRYTRWFNQQFLGLSVQNQAEFLVGITF